MLLTLARTKVVRVEPVLIYFNKEYQKINVSDI